MEHLLNLKAFGALLGGTTTDSPEVGAQDSQTSGEPNSSESPEIKKLGAMLRAAAIREDGTVPVLALEDTTEIAQLLVILAFLAGQPKHKDALSLIMSTYREGKDRNAALKAFESTLEYQELDWMASGEPKLSGSPAAPILKLKGSKVSELFINGPATLKSIGPLIAQEPTTHFDALAQTCLNRYTHSVKLSGLSGSGGFLRKAYPEHPDNEGSMSEADYRTRDRMSFDTTAEYAAWRVLTLCQVSFEGEVVNLPELVARPHIHQEVLSHLEASANSNIRGQGLAFAAMLEALTASATQELFNEAQVFVGTADAPIVLSVLSSVALPAEIRHAKSTLAIAYKEECAVEAEMALAEEAELKQQLKDAKVAARKASQGDASHQKVATLTEALAAKEDQVRGLKKGYLFVPSVTLPIGGAFPRNVGAALEKNLHSSNLFSKIHTTRPTHSLNPNTFYGGSLVKLVKIRENKLPPFFWPRAVDYAHKVQRAQMFKEVCLSVLEPLIALQQLYLSYEVDTATTLTSEAVEAIFNSTEAWALFVKGDPKLNSAEKTAALLGLSRNVSEAVKESFLKAFGKDFRNDFDDEISETVAGVIFKARA
ncbi:hypothetical protein LC612_33375 [Nostoc sp. CHAB 5834]|nr:hypothetical protein [Nostoc sp. CHAB 5834]